MVHCKRERERCRVKGREREVTISFKRVLPSLVSLISPAPPTSLQNKNHRERENQRENHREREREREKERERERHLDGAFGAEVGLEDILQALGGVDVHMECCRFVQHLRVWIQHSNRHFSPAFTFSFTQTNKV